MVPMDDRRLVPIYHSMGAHMQGLGKHLQALAEAGEEYWKIEDEKRPVEVIDVDEEEEGDGDDEEGGSDAEEVDRKGKGKA